MTMDHLDSRADVWLFNEDAVESAMERVNGWDVLSAQERARHERLVSARAQRLFLGGRLLLRFVLAAYTSIPPAEIRFSTGRQGRPELTYPDVGLRFNLSHTTGLVGCVVTRDRMCGFDIERVPAAGDIVAAVAQFLARAEREQVERSDDPNRATLEYWVVKEAYLKAMGLGLQRPLDSFTVSGLGSGEIKVQDSQTYGVAWQLDLEELTSDHVVGLALAKDRIRTDRIPVRLLDFDAFLTAAFPAVDSPATTPSDVDPCPLPSDERP